MRLIFDFDNTLFDTFAMRRDLNEAFAKAGIPPEVIETTYRAVAPDGFGYELEAQLAALSRHVPDQVMDEVRRGQATVLDRLSDYVFDGAERLLGRLATEGHELYLVTSGSDSWQNLKIDASGLARYFVGIHVVSGPKMAVLIRLIGDRDDRPVIINDNAAELRETVAAAPHARVIAVAGPLNDGQDLPCEIARDLGELARLLDK